MLNNAMSDAPLPIGTRWQTTTPNGHPIQIEIQSLPKGSRTQWVDYAWTDGHGSVQESMAPLHDVLAWYRESLTREDISTSDVQVP